MELMQQIVLRDFERVKFSEKYKTPLSRIGASWLRKLMLEARARRQTRPAAG